MKYLSFGLAAVLLGILAGWFGLYALAFALGHLWFDALVYGLLTTGASVLACFYSALLAVEWLKHRL